MSSVYELEDHIAELTGTKAHEWGTAMCPAVILDHPTAGRFLVFGTELHKIIPVDELPPEQLKLGANGERKIPKLGADNALQQPTLTDTV